MDVDRMTNLGWWQNVFIVLGALVSLAGVIILFFYTKYTKAMQEAVHDQVQIGSDQIAAISAQTEAIRAQTEKVAEQVAMGERQTQELIHQGRISLLPKITGCIGLLPDHDVFELTNIGNGVAVNLSVDDLRIEVDEGEWEMTIGFSTAAYLEPQESPEHSGTGHAVLQMYRQDSRYLRDDQKDYMSAAISILEPRHALRSAGIVEVTVSFDDIDGTRYDQQITLALGRDWLRPVALGPPTPVGNQQNTIPPRLGMALSFPGGGVLLAMADEMEADVSKGLLRLQIRNRSLHPAEAKVRVTDVRYAMGERCEHPTHIPLDLEWTHLPNTACARVGEQPEWIAVAHTIEEPQHPYLVLWGALYKEYEIRVAPESGPAYVQLGITSPDNKIHLLRWYRIELDTESPVRFRGEVVEQLPWEASEGATLVAAE